MNLLEEIAKAKDSRVTWDLAKKAGDDAEDAVTRTTDLTKSQLEKAFIAITAGQSLMMSGGAFLVNHFKGKMTAREAFSVMKEFVSATSDLTVEKIDAQASSGKNLIDSLPGPIREIMRQLEKSGAKVEKIVKIKTTLKDD